MAGKIPKTRLTTLKYQIVSWYDESVLYFKKKMFLRIFLYNLGCLKYPHIFIFFLHFDIISVPFFPLNVLLMPFVEIYMFYSVIAYPVGPLTEIY